MPACMRITPWKRLSDRQSVPTWQPVSIAPVSSELELAIINSGGVYAFFLPCYRSVDGWRDAKTKRRIEVEPTHWREWVVATK
jgi:hypothetical protein